jgi:hypothetical protein
MIPFFAKFEEIASRETRVITLPRAMHGLPADSYALVEFYCDEPDCDCRRVIIQVWKADQPGVSLATFNFGWESVQFYRRWTRGDAELAEGMDGLQIEIFGRQTALTEPLRALVESVLDEDPAYVERLKRHYEIFKGAGKGRSRTQRTPRIRRTGINQSCGKSEKNT